MASYTGLKKLGDGLLDYMMKHRPEVDEDMSAGLHDLGEMFPGVYEHGAKLYSTGVSADVDHEAMIPIKAVRGIPDAEVDIYRAVPKGVRDFNVGDWVTTSKSYAKEHGSHSLNNEYDIITGKAKASDLFNPGDSIAEMGYWGLPMAGTVTRGLIPIVGAGGMLALLGADEAEAAPAVKDFAKKYAKAVADGDKRMMLAGSLEPEVFEQAAKKERGLQNNRVFMGPHGGEARLATGEMEPEEVGQHVENLLNSGETRVLPNFPSRNFQNNAKNMLYLNDGKAVVAPFMAGKSGDVVLRTAFEPQKDRMKFIDDYLGRPKAPISGLRSDPASAQPQGLSVVKQSSTESSIPDSSKASKAIIPLTVGGVLVPTTAESFHYQFPADKPGWVNPEPGLESPLFDIADLATAPIGVPTAALKAASVAAEPFFAYGMDKLAGLLGKLWED